MIGSIGRAQTSFRTMVVRALFEARSVPSRSISLTKRPRFLETDTRQFKRWDGVTLHHALGCAFLPKMWYSYVQPRCEPMPTFNSMRVRKSVVCGYDCANGKGFLGRIGLSVFSFSE